MGLLIEGEWHDTWYDTKQTGGRFVRKAPAFRSWVSADSKDHAAAPGRYHLYVSYACPWAHRTLIVRKLKALDDQISVSVVQPLMLADGWVFDDEHPDHLHQRKFLRDVYTAAKSDFTGRVTVPVLWDKQKNTIVNNESSEIIRMLNAEFGSKPELDLYPKALRAEIDDVNDAVYDRVNNGVYKAGFATSQEAYDEAVAALFAHLDVLERRLDGQDYLVGGQLSEADIRLFTTLFRFDPVYVGHFKCNLRQIRDYPNLWRHTRRIYQIPGVAETCNLEHIRHHYYGSHATINPTGIVPAGPLIDFNEPL